ncbi:AAA family ATPase [Wolbachia endosymbiont (group B) of Horisme vitalbata]|uniref:AAA family ATPase n=1 Tax=Wolbachia endosymbiont (group B) of Horisme vitalbata TaxID=3066178 RepID=UPI003340952A
MNFNELVKNGCLKLDFKRITVSELVSFLEINSNITKLSLKSCYIGDEGAKALANGNLANRTQLDLSSNSIGDEGAKALANGNLANLTQLDLSWNKIDDEGAKALANGNLANLTQLDLSSNSIGDEGAKALANGNLANLTQLNLSSNSIGDEGAKALANGNLTNLTSLDVTLNKIDDKGEKALAGLKKVDVKGIENFRIIDSLTNRFTQSNSSIEIFDPAKSENKTTLDDIIISKSLRKELNKICGFISEVKRALLQKIGCKPQKGYIFYGPPGNGKTSIARAIAYQAKAKFISVSAPEFMKSYIGEGEKYVREIFKKARANAPCIIFIDEIDCIAKERGKGGNSTAAQSSERLVSQLLAELDGFNPLEGVTVIAATNFKDVLDTALTRSGRLSKDIEIPLPEKRQRKEILDFYIKKLKNSGCLEPVLKGNEEKSMMR